MKRGKDDEKIMGPMFPRLHVNDTEKGGPRAPPRNKMALYEQLTVPTQRYNIGAVPLNPKTNSSNLISSASTTTNQEMGRERNMYFPLHQPALTPSYDELQVRQQEAVSLTSEPTQAEDRKKSTEEDDFMVPIFSQPVQGQHNGKDQNNVHGERQAHLSSNFPISLLSNGNKQANKINGGNFISRLHVIDQDARTWVSDTSPGSTDISMGEKFAKTRSEDASVRGEFQEKQRSGSLENTNACLRHESEGSLLAVSRFEGAQEPRLESTQKEIFSRQKYNSQSACRDNDAHEIDYGMPRIQDPRSLEMENIDRGNDVSETSMVDILEMDITPDDVVDIIGRKHFWKARTAIVNQQRVFAVQVFELHRLIKVQKLIAGAPDLLLEGSAFVGKASLKCSTVKKYSSDYGVKGLAHSTKEKDDTEKPTDKMEGTAENAVTKVPLPSQHATQPSGYGPPSVNPGTLPPGNTDPKMTPWGFQQPALQQWLVPVMSPSEGLVYKPYPAPGMMGPMCGGCGPAGPTVGNMMNPYGMMPNHHYHQGMGVPPGIHFGGQGYFPPYPMPMMSTSLPPASAVDQAAQFSGPNSYDPTGQPTSGSVNGSLQRQSSCNKPSKKTGTVGPAEVVPPPKERELQGSTSSSPSETAQGTGMTTPTEGRDALPLFPTAPTNEIFEGALPTEKLSRVIRVVPHNPKSTRESAARIFQSIQAERRQYEST